MGLSTTLNIAQSSLAANAALSSVVSRNIAGVNDTGYSRKIASISTTYGGTGATLSVTRATNTALFANLLGATADSASSSALSGGLDTLEQTVGLSSSAGSSTSTSTATSPAALIGNLTNAIKQYATSPDDTTLGTAAITSANALATGLNSASKTVQSVRAQADSDIASAVSDVNSLLSQFQTVNTQIVKANASGSDQTDLLDKRDQLLLSLSGYMGISTIAQPDGGTAIYTDSGATLFQSTARAVTFQPTSTFATGASGNAVMVDGVAITGSSAVMALKSGSIAGLSQLRDTTAVAYQNQLDQIAGGLIDAFKETDQTGGSASTIAGLFTSGGSTALPTGTTGLAATIAVSANADPSRGGSLNNLRDGTVGDPGNSSYNGNTTGAASYATSLNGLLTSLGASRGFDGSSGGAAQGTLADYATSSVSWLESKRQAASDTATERSAVVSQTTASFSGQTGVNLDDQLSLMLDLEHSYQASAELMSTVKTMYTSLFTAMQ